MLSKTTHAVAATLALVAAVALVLATGAAASAGAQSSLKPTLYARVSSLGQIAIFSIGSDGSLTALPPLTGAPATLAGLAAF